MLRLGCYTSAILFLVKSYFCYTITSMAVYKVPQDVEADDKLIGPFSFRQFIYLIIVALSIAIAWGLYMLFPPLVVVPLPVIILFGALALPLRKDQPMETYLAALVSFYLKPRKRLWDPDGADLLVEITAPKTVEVQRTKNLSQNEAQQRLSYLADIADTQGWAIRGAGIPAPVSSNALNNDVYFEAQQTEDILDDNTSAAQSIDTMIKQSDQQRRQEAVDLMKQSAAQPEAPPLPDPYASLTPPDPEPASAPAPTPVVDSSANVQYDPYPASIRQAVVQPISDDYKTNPAAEAKPDTSEKAPSPDIIKLANNSDLSIQTIAHEAHRIKEQEESKEVIISLR